MSTAQCVQGPLAVSTARCVKSPLCPRPDVFKARCVYGLMFPRPNVSKARCVHGPMCSRPDVSRPGLLSAGCGHTGWWTQLCRPATAMYSLLASEDTLLSPPGGGSPRTQKFRSPSAEHPKLRKVSTFDSGEGQSTALHTSASSTFRNSTFVFVAFEFLSASFVPKSSSSLTLCVS